MLRTLVIILFLSSISIQLYSQESVMEWETLDTTTFTLSYPSDWDLDLSGIMGSEAFVFSRLTADTDDFRDNVNYLIQDLSGKGITFDQYMEISKAQIPTMMTEGKLISIVERDVDIGRSFIMIYEGKQGQFDLKFHGLVLMRNDQYHILTFSAEKESYDHFKDMGIAILDRFQLK